MSKLFDTREVEKRTMAVTYRDGLNELFFAAALLAIALAWLASVAFVSIVAAFVAIYGWKVLEKAREQITYPRLGYFRERADEPKRTARGILVYVAAAVVVMVLAIVIVGDIGDASEWRRAAPLLSGLTLAGAFWYTADRSGLRRHRVVAGYSVLTGAALWLAGSGTDYMTVVWHLLGLVVLLGVLGTYGLVDFLHSHPVVPQADDD